MGYQQFSHYYCPSYNNCCSCLLLLFWLGLVFICDFPILLPRNGHEHNSRISQVVFAQSIQSKMAGKDVRFQISLDSHIPSVNDEMRGPENFAKVVEAVPKLIDIGIQVRIASTLEAMDDLHELKSFVMGLGISEEDHIVRHIVQRGRAQDSNMGQFANFERFPPELTLTSEGAFWTPFGPTYRNGRLQTDLLICRTITPLNKPVSQLLNIVGSSELELDNQEGFV